MVEQKSLKLWKWLYGKPNGGKEYHVVCFLWQKVHGYAAGNANLIDGIGRIDFTSDTYKINKIAYSEAEYGTQRISYYIDNIKVSENDFMSYKAKQSEKQNVDWNPVTTNSAS